MISDIQENLFVPLCGLIVRASVDIENVISEIDRKLVSPISTYKKPLCFYCACLTRK